MGFSGHATKGIVEMNWVERSAQIGRDLRGGYTYVVETESGEVEVAAGDNLDLSANFGGRDLLSALDEAPVERGLSRLHLVEDYPDLYLSMRQGQ